MTRKRTIVIGLSVACFVFLASEWAFAAGPYGPGVSDTEIKIGNTMAYSGPASSYGTMQGGGGLLRHDQRAGWHQWKEDQLRQPR
jgi:hypothetical protein